MGEASFKALQQRGIRVTPQQAHVWRVLAGSGGHFTADEVWGSVKEVLPGVELSTGFGLVIAGGPIGRNFERSRRC